MRKASFSALLMMVLVLTACGDAAATVAPTTAATAAATAASRPTTAASAAMPAATAATTGGSAVAGAATPATSGSTPAGMAASSGPRATVGAMAATSGDPVVIGISVAQTSNTALLGQEEVNGAQIAEVFFNARGGINGRPIKLTYEDTAGDEMGAINAFQNQITKNRVVGIVGPTLSQQQLAAGPVANSAKVPVIGPSNTAKGIPAIGEYIRRVSAPVNLIAPQSIRAAKNQNPMAKNVAVFYAQNDAFSVGETAVFQDTAKELGLTVTTVQKFQTTDTDFTTQITAATATKPDIAIVSGLAADGGNLVRQLRELGFKGAIVGGNGLNTANIFPVCKALCDGIFIAQAYSPEADSDINKAFREAYKAKFNADPPQFAAQTFSGVQVFVDALKAIDSKTKLSTMSVEDLRVALNKQINDTNVKYGTPLGDIAFDAQRELIQGQLYVAQIKMNPDGATGKFTFLK